MIREFHQMTRKDQCGYPSGPYGAPVLPHGRDTVDQQVPKLGQTTKPSWLVPASVPYYYYMAVHSAPWAYWRISRATRCTRITGRLTRSPPHSAVSTLPEGNALWSTSRAAPRIPTRGLVRTRPAPRSSASTPRPPPGSATRLYRSCSFCDGANCSCLGKTRNGQE